jgi:hypothetical protein
MKTIPFKKYLAKQLKSKTFKEGYEKELEKLNKKHPK